MVVRPPRLLVRLSYFLSLYILDSESRDFFKIICQKLHSTTVTMPTSTRATTTIISVSRSGPVWFFSLFWTRLGPDQSFPFWEKTEPDWEKPVYIGPVLDICQL